MAFSSTAILNALTPRSGYSTTAGIAYGAGPRGKLDVYRPKRAADAPVAVFFYGGRWQSGERGDYRFVAASLARRGILAIVPDYRLYPEVRFPGFLKDGAAAVQWARAEAPRFGGSPERLFVIGHSAGAHVAAMLALEPRWLGRPGGRHPLAGWVGLAGPYDFLPVREPNLIELFGGPAQPETQPIRHVARPLAPALLITGEADRTVDPGNSDRLAAAIRADGGDVTVRHYPHVGHLGLIGAMAWPLRWHAPVLADTASFILDGRRADRAAAMASEAAP